MSEAPTIEGNATEVDEAEKPEPVSAANATQTEVAVVHRPVTPPTRQALMPLSAEDVVAGMQAYQQLLPQLLDDSDYQAAGKDRKFVKKSGWRKIARAFNLSVTVESLRVERDEDGNPLRAECVARASAPNGQVQDGDGYCSADETRFNDASGRQKLENDLRATATTRAKNRAIADLVGMGEVSAEEINASGQPPAAVDAIEYASADEVSSARRALGSLCRADDEPRPMTEEEKAHALALWTEALSHSENRCPKGLAVLLIRLGGEPMPIEAEPGMTPDDSDLPKAA